jgi:hypothetical protein
VLPAVASQVDVVERRRGAGTTTAALLLMLWPMLGVRGSDNAALALPASALPVVIALHVVAV